jgi:small-conductance mechanosensitive channel
MFAAAVIVAYIAGLFASYYIKRRFSHRIKKDILEFWIRVLRAALIVAAVAVTVPPLFDAGIVIIVWILIGFFAVFAVAGQKVFSNIVASFVLMYERPFSSGDFITIGDVSGTVVSVSLFATMVRTVRGEIVHVPNEQVYTTTTTNHHANVARRFEYSVGIRYRDDASRAIGIISPIIDMYPFALKNPSPEIFVADLAESSVTIRIRLWFPSAYANTQDDVSLGTAILPAVKSALGAEGIEIPFPQRTLWFERTPLPQD